MPRSPSYVALALLLGLAPACGAVGDDDDSVGDDDDSVGDDDDDSVGDDDDSVGDDDDSVGDDDDSVGDDDDSAAADGDGDGHAVGVDCDDNDAAVHPGAAEVCASVVDDDCDPATDCSDTCLVSFDYGVCDSLPVVPNAFLSWTYDTLNNGVVADSGTSGTSGFATGAPAFAPGVLGDGVALDGSSWIFAPQALALPTSTFTMATWVRADLGDNAGPYHFLMSSGNGLPAFTGAGLYAVSGNGTGALIEGGTGAAELLPAGGVLCDGGWAFVALRFDNGQITLNLDGPEHADFAAPYTDVVWGARVFGVGNDPNNLSRAFVGSLDETVVFDFALDDNTLAALQASTLCAR